MWYPAGFSPITGRFRTYTFPLDRLPVAVTWRASAPMAGFSALAGLGAAGLLGWQYVTRLGPLLAKIRHTTALIDYMLGATLLPPALAGAVGLWHLARSTTVTITPLRVSYRSRSLFGVRAWSEDLAAYAGLGLRQVTRWEPDINHGIMSRHAPVTVVVLVHPDDRRSIGLFGVPTYQDVGPLGAPGVRYRPKAFQEGRIVYEQMLWHFSVVRELEVVIGKIREWEAI